jgi:membrane protease YdiL (CAAX protease family)
MGGGGVLDASPRIGRMIERAEEGGWRSVAILRLIPGPPHSGINTLLALTNLSWRDYLIGSFLGMLPITFVQVDIGVVNHAQDDAGQNHQQCDATKDILGHRTGSRLARANLSEPRSPCFADFVNVKPVRLHGGGKNMDAEPIKPARIGPWTAIGLMIVAFAILEFLLPMARAAIVSHLSIVTPRDKVAVSAVGSIVLVWLLFGAAWIILGLRGQNLRSIGWKMSSSIWGWLLGFVFGVLYAGFTVMGMIHAGAPVLTDWSVFRILVALGIGISAGICEETVFRGFVMSQANDGGAHWTVQILLSAVLFGLAHMGWGGLNGHVQMAQMIGAMSATAILGLMLAITYLASGRSLTPTIIAHATIDIVIEPWLLLYAVTGGHF